MNKIKSFFERVKYIWNISESLEDYYNDIITRVNWIDAKIGERTTVHADIGYKGTGSQIIVVGRYQGKDYVRSFNVRNETLHSLIDMLRREEKNAGVGKFDMIGGIEFSAVYDRERF